MSPIKVTPQQILTRLEAGETRQEIQESLGLSNRDIKMMFQHPLLKGKKTAPKPGFVWAEEEEEIQESEVIITEEIEDIEELEAEEIVLNNTGFFGRKG